MYAPKRRSFWKYNKDNGYWILYPIFAGFIAVSVKVSVPFFIWFFSICLAVVIGKSIQDYKKNG